jgi:hypothetical protein
MISAEERHANKEKARRVYEEAFGGGNAEPIDELLHSEFVCHDPNCETTEVREHRA